MSVIIKIIEIILNTPVTSEPKFIAHVLIWLAFFSAFYEVIYGLTMFSKKTAFVIGFALTVFSAQAGLNIKLFKLTTQFAVGSPFLIAGIWFFVWLLSSLGFGKIFEWIKEKKAEARLEKEEIERRRTQIFGEELKKV